MTNYPNGQVILSIEKYNEMLAEVAAVRTEIARIKGYFTLEERSWSSNLELMVDKELVVQVATELFPTSPLSKKYDLRDADDIYYASTIVGEVVLIEECTPVKEPTVEDGGSLPDIKSGVFKVEI